MSTTVTTKGFPIPNDDDTVEAGAQRMRELAAAIDLLTPTVLDKLVDETVTNSAVMQDDDRLAFPVVAGKTYVFDLVLGIVSNVNTSDFKCGFTFPAGSQVSYGATGPDPAATGVISSESNVFVPVATSGTAHTSFGALTSDLTVRLSGRIVAGATGTMRFQWAQLTAAAGTGVTVRAGSFIRSQRIAL